MRFDDFDKAMRRYEESLDQYITPGMYIVVRLDGRGFSKLTKNMCYKKPFDIRFKDVMGKVTRGLMEESGLHFVYGFTESDEISLFLAPNEDAFSGKTRKLNSVLAGVASSIASRALDAMAVFDCRIVPLPNKEAVIDYFMWRQEDAARNALNGYCFWTAIQEDGLTNRAANSLVSGKSNTWKHDFLYQHGIVFGESNSGNVSVPEWQKRGFGFVWKTRCVLSFNKMTGEPVYVTRKYLQEQTLPYGKDYAKFVADIVDNHCERK